MVNVCKHKFACTNVTPKQWNGAHFITHAPHCPWVKSLNGNDLGSLLQFLTGSNIIIYVTFTNVDGNTCCPFVQTCGSTLELIDYHQLINIHYNELAEEFMALLRACSRGGGEPQVGEVPRLGGVTNLSIQSLFISWLLSHERWDTSPGRVAWSAVPGNPLRWGKFSPCECWRWGGVGWCLAGH